MEIPQPAEPVPPTLNELDTLEKARLLKKARKLSRVFGEVPVLEEASLPLDDPRDNPVEAEHLQRPFTLSASGNSKRRSLLRLSYQPDMSNQTPANDSNAVNETRPSLLDSNIIDVQDDNQSDSSITIISPEQERRIRLAKLTRYLGENVPPELVLRTDEIRINWSQSLGTSYGVEQKGRKRYDVVPNPPPASDDAFLIPQAEKPASRWASGMGAIDQEPLPDTPQEYMSDRERVLNVKRVRKMTQVLCTFLSPPFTILTVSNQLFGHDPPLELIHVTHRSPDSFTAMHVNRDSIATFHTFSSESTTSLPVPSMRSLSAVTDPSSLTPCLPPRTPPTGNDTMPAPHDAQSASFQERRRRATKLAQFFGVAYHDISSSLAVPERTVFSAKPTNIDPKEDSTVQVDIKISGRNRLWGLADGRNNLREVDIVDARDKLRILKAA
jgi:hypothetical protein